MKKLLNILFLVLLLVSQNIIAGGAQGINENVLKLYNETEYQEVIELLKNKNQSYLTANEYYYLGLSYSFAVRKLWFLFFNNSITS